MAVRLIVRQVNFVVVMFVFVPLGLLILDQPLVLRRSGEKVVGISMSIQSTPCSMFEDVDMWVKLENARLRLPKRWVRRETSLGESKA